MPNIRTRTAAKVAASSAFSTTPATPVSTCLLYTSDAADERSSVDLGGRRIIKKKRNRSIEGSADAVTTPQTTQTAHTEVRHTDQTNESES